MLEWPRSSSKRAKRGGCPPRSGRTGSSGVYDPATNTFGSFNGVRSANSTLDFGTAETWGRPGTLADHFGRTVRTSRRRRTSMLEWPRSSSKRAKRGGCPPRSGRTGSSAFTIRLPTPSARSTPTAQREPSSSRAHRALIGTVSLAIHRGHHDDRHKMPCMRVRPGVPTLERRFRVGRNLPLLLYPVWVRRLRRWRPRTRGKWCILTGATEWIDAGMPWRGRGRPAPKDWNPGEQVTRIAPSAD